MNELFWPSETSDSAGDTLIGTMTADRASGPPIPATYESVIPVQPQGQAAPRPDPVASLGQFQAAQQAQKGQEAPPFKSITMKADGTFKMEGDQSMLAEVMGQLTDLKTMKTAAMARVAELRQQEASGSPLIDALSTFAGNMAANDPTLPGWVRALGATNLQMGPQGIRARREAEEQKALQLTKLTADTALDAAKLEDEKYKVTLSMVQNMMKDAAKAEKDATTAYFQMRREARGQIERTGSFDAEGLAAEMQSVGLPPEQIEAQIESLRAYAEERNDYTQRLAAAADAKERKKIENQWALFEERARLSDERLTRMLTAGQSKFEFTNSVPKPADVEVLKNTSSMLRLLDDADAFIGTVPEKYQGGPVMGWLNGKNPWRDPKFQKAMMTSYQLTLKSLEESGLKPISEIEFNNAMKQMFSGERTFKQNKEIIGNLREMLLAGTKDYMVAQPQRNWTVTAGILPPQLQELLPELERRRARMYSEMAPPGVGRRGGLPSLPDGWSVEEVP